MPLMHSRLHTTQTKSGQLLSNQMLLRDLDNGKLLHATYLHWLVNSVILLHTNRMSFTSCSIGVNASATLGTFPISSPNGSVRCPTAKHFDALLWTVISVYIDHIKRMMTDVRIMTTMDEAVWPKSNVGKFPYGCFQSNIFQGCTAYLGELTPMFIEDAWTTLTATSIANSSDFLIMTFSNRKQTLHRWIIDRDRCDTAVTLADSNNE